MNTSEKNPFTTTPVYYIIVEQNCPQGGFYLSIGKILRVFETTAAQIDRLHREHIMPLINEGRNVQGVCYYREPGNPFRERERERERETMEPLAMRWIKHDDHATVRLIGEGQNCKTVYRVRYEAIRNLTRCSPGEEYNTFGSLSNEDVLSLLEELTEEELSLSIEGYINRLAEVGCGFSWGSEPCISRDSLDKPRYHVYVRSRMEEKPLLFDTLEGVDAFIRQQHRVMVG